MAIVEVLARTNKLRGKEIIEQAVALKEVKVTNHYRFIIKDCSIKTSGKGT